MQHESLKIANEKKTAKKQTKKVKPTRYIHRDMNINIIASGLQPSSPPPTLMGTMLIKEKK